MHKPTVAKSLLMLAVLLAVVTHLLLTVTAQTQNPRPNQPAQGTPQPPQGPGGPPRPPGGGGGGGFANAYPQRPPAPPEVIERGKAQYSVHCGFCHGGDARGGSEGGPSLIRSDVVLNDQKGELIAPVIQNGRGAMPKFSLTMEQISDIAAFIHSFRVGGYDISRNRPTTIVVGEAKAGEAYFNATCAKCHSVTGDLKGYAARFNNPRQMQQTWLMPGSGGGFGGGGGGQSRVSPTTVTVTLAAGKQVKGTLRRLDDFLVTLIEADGTPRTFRRNGDVPKVEIHDPVEPHRDLLSKYTDKDIHNVTAYLESLK